MAFNTSAYVTSINCKDVYKQTLLSSEEFLQANPDWRTHKEDFKFICPGCGVSMHLCRGGEKRASYFSAGKNIPHAPDCRFNHHQDETQKQKALEYRKNRKEISIEKNVSIGDFQKRISAKTVREFNEHNQSDDSNSLSKPQIEKNEVSDGKSIIAVNIPSEKEVGSIVDLYKLKRRLNDNENLFCKETKLKYRFGKGEFEKPVLVLAYLLENPELLTEINAGPIAQCINPFGKPSALMCDCFRVSESRDRHIGQIIEHNEEKVLFYLLFNTEWQKSAFDKRFRNYTDGKGRVRANNTNRMPHLVLCRWSKEYEFTDNSGLRRRIVAGMITNGEEEIRKLEIAVFDEFENESPRR